MPRSSDPPPLTAKVALFLDIDGTLLEFAPAPDQVKVTTRVFTLLNALADRLNGAVALVTGRAIADVDRLFPGLQLPVSGQHGCERRAATGNRFVHAPTPAATEQLRVAMHKLAADHPGLMLEDKGITLALHYRRVPHLAAFVHRAVRDLLAPAVASGAALQLLTGKMIVEVKPDGRDKGTAILDYMNEAPFAGRIPVFVGDDDTDEHGFHAVHAWNGWSVKVGPGPTHAEYRLTDVKAVLAWLTMLEKQDSPAVPTHDA
jgi:trehalose 6-phosphate phosphatase